jgi:thiamine-phosphate pyrophosphorylase
MRLPDPPILVITDRRQALLALEDIARRVFAAGCRWLSLREKDLPPPERLALLRRLLALGHEHGARVSVHEDLEAAVAAGADGVHLPTGVAPAGARARLGPAALIGCSAHDRAELAAARGADYATLSPIFISTSKPGYGPPLGIAGLAAAIPSAPLPVLALGGIAAGNAALCLSAGARGIAVMGAVMAAPDPATVMTGLIGTLAAALAAGRGATP